ncbi:L,D-transpeptidase family protein [Thiolapillus sp.]
MNASTRSISSLLLVALLCSAQWGLAATYRLSDPEADLIGSGYWVTVQENETLLDIARRHDIGQEEILLANPGVDRWLPTPGSRVFIPARYVLPAAERKGLILNLPEMRLYYFVSPEEVATYPVSIGRMDWKTPLGKARIVRKQKSPSWYPPESVKKEAAASGETVPDVVPPGPDNPLGAYALRLNLPGYLIHGTNKPYGVGMRVTHGCVRLLPEDIEELFHKVRVNTQVQIVNQPVKVGWLDGVLYLEVHPPVEEHLEAREDMLRYALEVIYQELEKHPAILIGANVKKAIEEQNGVPLVISRKTDEPPMPIRNPVFD